MERLILDSAKKNPQVKDIEHVLQALDAIVTCNSNTFAREMLSTITAINLSGLSPTGWKPFTDAVAKLREKVLDRLYDEYHFKEESKNIVFSAFDDLFDIIDDRSRNRISRDIFTLNYDRTIDEYLLEKHENTFVDGFENSKHRRFWKPAVFEKEQPNFRLFKLHGSLNWRERTDGAIECGTTEEPSRNTYYRKNVFIYPTESCDETKEPYRSLYKHFRDLKGTADLLIVVGYAFRDDPINNTIIEFASSPGVTVIPISPTVKEDIQQLGRIDNQTVERNLMPIEGRFPDPNVLGTLQEIIINIEK